jgi:hypothetical protein
MRDLFLQAAVVVNIISLLNVKPFMTASAKTVVAVGFNDQLRVLCHDAPSSSTETVPTP